MRNRLWQYGVVATFVLIIGIWAVLISQPATVAVRPHLLLLGLLLAIGLLMTLEPLGRLYMRLRSNWGSRLRPDRQSLIEQMVESLAIVRDQQTLQALLVQRLSSLLGTPNAALYLRHGEHELRLAEATYSDEAFEQQPIAANGQLVTHLLSHPTPVSHALLVENLASAKLAPSEDNLLAHPWALWLPLQSSGRLQGLLILGTKGSPYSRREQQILNILAHQAGISAQAARLTEEVRMRQQELALANVKLLEAGEKERRRLARELHDGALQELIGISYQLAQLTPGADAEQSTQIEAIRSEILGVAASLRFRIGELRPAGLEELGLVSALESYIGRLERTSAKPQIITHFEPELIDLPLPIALGLFRVAQEAIANARKHANAHHVWIDLAQADSAVTLQVRDDGQGFEVPERLSELASVGHYGLVSLAERTAQIGGQLTIESRANGGTRIQVLVAQPEETRSA